MRLVKRCQDCKKHTSTLYANRCKRCYTKYKEVEDKMFEKAKGLSIRIFEKGGLRH